MSFSRHQAYLPPSPQDGMQQFVHQNETFEAGESSGESTSTRNLNLLVAFSSLLYQSSMVILDTYECCIRWRFHNHVNSEIVFQMLTIADRISSRCMHTNKEHFFLKEQYFSICLLRERYEKPVWPMNYKKYLHQTDVILFFCCRQTIFQYSDCLYYSQGEEKKVIK